MAWSFDWLIDRLIDRLIDWLTSCFFGSLIDRLFVLLIDWLNDGLILRLTDWPIDWSIDWLTNFVFFRKLDWSTIRPVDRLIEWWLDPSIDWLTDWLIDWSIDWLIDDVLSVIGFPSSHQQIQAPRGIHRPTDSPLTTTITKTPSEPAVAVPSSSPWRNSTIPLSDASINHPTVPASSRTPPTFPRFSTSPGTTSKSCGMPRSISSAERWKPRLKVKKFPPAIPLSVSFWPSPSTKAKRNVSFFTIKPFHIGSWPIPCGKSAVKHWLEFRKLS